MSDQPTPFRDLNEYFPFELTVKVIPMYFVHNLEKKFVKVAIKVYLDELEFNTDRESDFKLLSDEAVFAGSMYDALLAFNGVEEKLELLNSTARKMAGFDDLDVLREITIDSEETLAVVLGERILDGAADLVGDPSKTFGSAQNKFDRLKKENPALVQLYYGLVLQIFAQKVSPKQKFYQRILANLG